MRTATTSRKKRCKTIKRILLAIEGFEAFRVKGWGFKALGFGGPLVVLNLKPAPCLGFLAPWKGHHARGSIMVS